jgi:hypothetical protein
LNPDTSLVILNGASDERSEEPQHAEALVSLRSFAAGFEHLPRAAHLGERVVDRQLL